jgi:hypothetical protein
MENPIKRILKNRSLPQQAISHIEIPKLPKWKVVKRLLLKGMIKLQRRRRKLKGSGPTVAHDRWLTTWAAIGTIAVPVVLGMLLATPAGISAYFAMMRAAEQNDSLRLIAIFATLNTIATVSGLMYLIGRNWSLFSHVERLAKEIAATRSTVDHIVVNVDSLPSSPKGSNKKRRDVPATWRSVCSYQAIHPRFMREMDFVPVGNGQFRLDVHLDWAQMWADRLMNPALQVLEIVLFISREDSILTQSSGRTLLRFAKLLDSLNASIPEGALNKIRVHLAEAAEVHHTFFIVKRNVSGRIVEMVMQYSRSVDELGSGAMIDAEYVEEVINTHEKDNLKWAAARYMAISRPVPTDAVRAVFRDILRADSFRPLKYHEWRERIEALWNGISPETQKGISVIMQSSSEFRLVDHPFPWETRDREVKTGPNTQGSASSTGIAS